MFERIRYPRLVATATAIALGVSACGSSHPNKTGSYKRSGAQPSAETFKVIYYSNGSRKLEAHGSERNFELSSIMEWCDGGDLIRESYFDSSGSYGPSESPTSVSPSDPKCSDGKLTPSDFRHNTSNIEVTQG